MRRLIALLAIASLAGILFAQLLWGKQKCSMVCITITSPLCWDNRCVWVLGHNRNLECHHIPHDIHSRTRDVYLWQCVPCLTLVGAREPQYMQWYELKIYMCGVKCYEEFVTEKGKGPQEAIPVPLCLPTW